MRTDINIGDEVYFLVTSQDEIVTIESLKVDKIVIDKEGEWVLAGVRCISIDRCFKTINEVVADGKKRAIERYQATIDKLDIMEKTKGFTIYD